MVGVLEGLGDLDADPRHTTKVLSLGLGGQLRLMTLDRRTRWIHWRAGARSRCASVARARRVVSAGVAPVELSGVEPEGEGRRQAGTADGSRSVTPLRLAPQSLDFVEDGVEPLPSDELHDVVVQAVVLADAEDGHDVRVMQPCRRAGLTPESFEPGRVAEMVEWQRLQCHVPSQRFLDCLVNDAHPAGPDAAQQHGSRPVVLALLPAAGSIFE